MRRPVVDSAGFVILVIGLCSNIIRSSRKGADQASPRIVSMSDDPCSPDSRLSFFIMVSSTRSVIVLLLFGMMAQINCVAVYCGLFSMNRSAIARTVCEKRTKNCCGRCFLNKTIASAQESQQDSPEKAPSNKSIDQAPDPMPGLEPGQYPIPHPSANAVPKGLSGSWALDDGVLHPIDHPPDLLS